jgi:hypothetical protein
MKQVPWQLNVHTEPFVLFSEDEQGPLYRKELAYPGRFIERDDCGRVVYRLTIDEPLIDHWVKTHAEMIKDGVKVPMPIGHVTDPEAKRADAERLAKEPSDNPKRKGQPALFVYTRFRDAETAKTLKNSDVSLYMPPMRPNGLGKIYERPITHVAFTDYPVLPDLGRFKPVAAGFEFNEEEQMGPYCKLAERLGIEIPENCSEEEAADAIAEAFDSEPDTDPEGGSPPVDDQTLPTPDDVLDDDDEFPNPPPAMSYEQPLPTTVKRECRHRAMALDGLKRKLPKPVLDKLKKKYCAEQTVAFALSLEAQGEPPDDFDEQVAIFSMLPDLVRGEQTGAQVLKDDDNPIMRDAEKRAEAARNARAMR